MNKTETDLSALEQICRQQYEEIQYKKQQIWDVEEENRLLRLRIQELEGEVGRKTDRVNELEQWCAHLQSIVDEEARQREEREQQYRRLEQRYGVFFRLARRFIQHL